MVIIMYYGRSSKHNGGAANSRGGSNASHNDSGRAFEYACMAAVYQLLRGYRDKSLIAHKPSMGLNMAKHAWGDIDRTMQAKLTRAAYSMTEQLLEYEPRLSEGSDVVSLRLQDDDAGEAGDVRDIVISRSDINWEIGLSVKHNHFAVKHSRLSPTIDFGKKWYKLPCSAEYWRAVKPIFDYLAEAQSKGQRWSELPSKEDDVYVPLLEAFMDELRRANTADPTFPRRMVEYLLGEYDFYKVIYIDSEDKARVEPFNLRGTLNQAGAEMPKNTAPLMTLPERIVDLKLLPYGKNKVELKLDHGWAFSFRIHNASSYVEQSLKFDVQRL